MDITLYSPNVSVCFIAGHGDRDLSILQNKEIALHGYEISFRERESPDLGTVIPILVLRTQASHPSILNVNV